MSNAYDIKLDHGDLLTRTRAGEDYQMHYSYKPINSQGQAEEQTNTQDGIVIVFISDVVLDWWQIKGDGDDLKKVLYQYARQYLIKLAEEGKLGGTKRHDPSGTAPQNCPFDLTRIKMEFGMWFRVARKM